MLWRYRESLRLWSDPVGRALFRLHLRPNHLTVLGLGVSFAAATAFGLGRTRCGGLLLVAAGLCDFFDGSLARASGQVTPFGGFLDSVIDRYSDLLVLLAIVVLYAQMPHARGAVVAMAGLVGSTMVSYTKARAASVGVECNVGMMERPERLICLIAGAILDLLEPALWILALLSNITAIQRILYTRRALRVAPPRVLTVLALAASVLAPGVASTASAPAAIAPDTERAWTRAVEALQGGDPAPAAREFATEAAQRSPVADYLRVVLADALARRGDLAGARAALIAVADRQPDSRLAPASLVEAAVLAARAGDDAGAQALLTRMIDAYPDARELPEALYLLGTIGEARGQRDAAALAYRELRVLAPTTGWAAGAADRLTALAAAGVTVPELSLSQRIDRAERLLRGGVPGTAADEAERIAKDTQDPGLGVRALRVVAEASKRLKRYDLGARALDLAANRAPADLKSALRLEQARLLLRAGRREPALTALATVERQGAEAEQAEAAYLRAETLEQMEREPQAVTAYRHVTGRYPAREVAGEALWRLGWIAYLKGDARGAEKEWQRVTDIPGGRARRVAALYWTARAKEQTAGRPAAERGYRQVLQEAPRSYYGVLAAQRVQAASAQDTIDGHGPSRFTSPEPAIRLPADPAGAVAEDPGFLRFSLLRRLGLVEFSWQELDDVVQRSTGDTVRLYGLSHAYVTEERYHLAIRILRRHFTGLAESGHPSLPRAFWEMLYPFAWRTEITQAAERAGVDPFLVAAVIRQESAYYPQAVSRAGARGLMQLMPDTARPMAEGRRLPFRGGELLDSPGVNAELGASFLGGMLKEFGDPRLALAAYNAGPRRARQWWKARRTNDAEAFVEQIPFDETRDYVKRVMFYWDEYRRLYGGT
ncbi:MAG: transglycosylase SLT domain-containing protein [Candidatus Rokubacteria bacterium]|nr:transglycosylase SLT domain-containing protein [Candidatus Rokubacteria bacterium]